jgi:copper chaperone CopZ
MNIDGELEDTEGVKSSSTNYAKQETEIEFDEKKIDEIKIKKIIKEVGYTAITS